MADREYNQRYYAERRAELKAQQAAYRADPTNREKARQRTRAWHAQNKERAKDWEAANADKRRLQNVERHKQRSLDDPDYVRRHRQLTRYNMVLHRHPHFRSGVAKFYAEQTRSIYDNCPAGLEVDHVHPLRPGNSCGLHVPWNLQYLTKVDNARKGRKLED